MSSRKRSSINEHFWAGKSSRKVVNKKRRLFSKRTPPKPASMTSRKFSFSELPEYVIDKIFLEYLSLVDRKRFRLVSRECFYLCSAFEDDEKLCIRGEYYDLTDRVLHVLLKSSRQILHLELEHLEFVWSPLWDQFWRVLGSRVRSLVLKDSEIPRDFCICWLRECSALEVLEFHVETLSDVVDLIDAVMHLNDSFFSNPSSLSKFEVFVGSMGAPSYKEVWQSVVDLLWEFFPNIYRFPVCCFQENMERLPLRSFEETSSHLLESWRQRQIYVDRGEREEARSNRHLESVIHRFPSNEVIRVGTFSKSMYPTIFIGSKKLLVFVVDFVFYRHGGAEQTILAEIPGHQLPREKDFGKLFGRDLPRYLECPMVKKMRILSSDSVVYWNHDWIDKISGSNLTSVRIVCEELRFKGAFSSLECPKVISFTLDTRKSYIHREFSVIKLLKAFPKLENLHLGYANKKILEYICETQSELESLTIGKMLTHGYCVESTYQSVNLSKLRHLQRLEIPQNIKFEGEKLTELKCLLVTGMHKVIEFQFDLKPYCEHFPSLEVAWFDQFVLPVGFRWDLQMPVRFVKCIVDDFLDRHPKLKLLYLSLSDAYAPLNVIDLRPRNLRRTFLRHPSLQIFVHNKAFVRNQFYKGGIQSLDVDVDRIHEFMLRFPHILRPDL